VKSEIVVRWSDTGEERQSEANGKDPYKISRMLALCGDFLADCS